MRREGVNLGFSSMKAGWASRLEEEEKKKRAAI